MDTVGAVGTTVGRDDDPSAVEPRAPVVVDLLGLSVYGDEFARLALAAQVTPTDARETLVVSTPAERLEVLARLQEGAGWQVLTGPLGRWFWELAGIEVQVKVVPDGYEHRERTDLLAYSLRFVGVPAEDVGALAKKPPKSPRHKYAAKWEAARVWREAWEVQQATVEPLVYEAHPFEVVDVERMCRILAHATAQRKVVAVDWEWHRQTKQPVGLAVSDEAANYYCPLLASDYRAPDGDAARLQDMFGIWVEQGVGVMHGGQADLGTVLPFDPADLCGHFAIDDTMVMAYLLGEDDLHLKALTRKYLGRDPIENEYEWADMPVRFTARYAAGGDTRNTYDLYVELHKRLSNMGRQYEIYTDYERPLIPRAASMERGGVPVDIPETLRQYRKCVEEEELTRRAVMLAFGYDLKDDGQTRQFIVSQGFADPGTLDQRVITLNQHWCIDLILLYRRTRTRRRNFLGATIKAWVEAGKPADFRLHPHFNQCGSMDDEAKRAPRSGRFSSSKPNFQQQPRTIRAIFRAPKGHLWWSFDYSGLELRLAAAWSQDKNMVDGLTERCPDDVCKHFPKHGDLHSKFQWGIKERSGQMMERPAVKTGNFEQLYGGGAEQLVRILAKERVFITRATGDIIAESHEATFPTYHQRGREEVLATRLRGYAETMNGRRRLMPELLSQDAEVVGRGERAAVNHAIQGTGADIVKKAMQDLAPVLRKYGAHLAAQVHDELDGWLPETADWREFEREVKEVMEMTVNGMKLVVEGGTANGTARTWDEAH